MPLYEICHSIPLSRPQKDALAEFLTHLHSTTFLTPTLFVNVRFTRPEPDGDFYLAGKPRQPNAPNRILAMVRTGPTRPKEKYDQMAVKIQHKWYEVVNDPNIAVKLGNMTEREERRHKKLHFVVFHPMITAVENGAIISGPGDEGTWLKDNMAFFKEQAEVHDDDEFRDMLKEVEERPDLRALAQ